MNILSFTAINPSRRYPMAEMKILQIEGVSHFVFDASDDFEQPWWVNIFRKYQSARLLALEGGFDYLLTAESDMLIPPDAVKRLASHNAPVAYGLYALRHGAPLWNAFVALDDDAGFSLSDCIVRHNAPNEWRAALHNQPFTIYGAGFGCTLIHRDVLERLEFRNDRDAFFVDWFFASDCNKLGIKQICDPRVVCGHINEQGEVIWPDLAHEKTLCRVEALGA